MKIHDWVKKSVGYEIYPRSFYDSNQDGMGDIQGIISKLDYLEYLGVNLLWIGPFYPSPLDDNGYDVSEFCDVDPSLGTLEDIKELIQLAHQKSIRIIFDYVMNQTSDEHPWFIESKSSTNNPKREYYLWAKGKGKNPPNNWGSFFGGSAWNYSQETDEYYMKIFSNKMPDLNWSSKNVQNEMAAVAKFWLDLGVDGFRMDAIAHLGRDMSFKDSTLKEENGIAYDWSKFSNREVLYTYLNNLHNQVFSKYSCVTIGEVGGGAKLDSALRYVNQKKPAIDMVFNFDSVWCLNDDGSTNVVELKKTINYWITGSRKAGIYLPQYWTNHDHPRAMSQYGNLEYFKESGKLLALVLLGLYGLPFIYNGEEIGMTNVDYTQLSDFKDVSSQNYFKMNQNKQSEQEMMEHIRKSGRDHGHLPMQWSDEKYAGFSNKSPYLKVNGNYKEINVQQQLNDSDSILNFYKQMIELRLKSQYSKTLIDGDFKLVLARHKQIFGYIREDDTFIITVLANMSNSKANYRLTDKEILLQNYEAHKKGVLQPYEAILMVEVKK